MKKPKLTQAQIDALYKFSTPGGHGYGEYAYLSRTTAEALAKRGLVELGTSKTGMKIGGSDRAPRGILTKKGLQVLNEGERHKQFGLVRTPEETSLGIHPYDWVSQAESKRQWDEWARRTGMARFRRSAHAHFTKTRRSR